jgi:predicted transglutaminase-like cysteine proteinase
MFVRAATSALAALVFAVSIAGSKGSPLQPADTFAVPTAATDEERRDQLQDSSGTVMIDATEPTAMVDFWSEGEPFSLATTMISAGPIVTMWEVMENRIRADREALMRCRETTERCSAAAQSFLAIVAEGRKHAGRARIGMINRAINLRIHTASVDYWTPPLETLAMGRGNCKQYAIAKYLALIEAGISENDVRLVIVRDLATAENHAVAAVRLNSDWLMLDNRWLNMVQDTDLRGVVPLFVLDRRGVKQFFQ